MYLSIFEICSDRIPAFISFLNDRGYKVVSHSVQVVRDVTSFITVVTKMPVTDNGKDAHDDIEGFLYDDFDWFVSSVYTD